MKKRITILFILFAVMSSYSFVQAQEQGFSKNSIKVGIGVGASSGSNTDGFGVVYSLGYQREIWKDRLRVNPNFSIGHYSSQSMLDAPDLYFNSTTLVTNLYFDLIRVKSFSLVLGCGALVNKSKGLKGTGGDFDPEVVQQSSEYVSNYHVGGTVAAGFRFNSPNKRTAINIMPITIRFGNNYFAEFHTKVEFDFKF